MNPVGDQLVGARVLLTGQRRSAELAAALERRGARIAHAPTLSVVPHVDDAELLRATKELIAEPPQIVVGTTGVGFTGWIEAADAAGLADELLAMLRDTRIIARGPKTSGALRAAGLEPDWVAESETNAEVRDFLLSESIADLRIAVQHHGAGSDGLDEAFTDAGATVQPLVVYRWGPAADPRAVADGVRRVVDREYDSVVFTSAPGAQAFLDSARGLGLERECVAAMAVDGGVVAAAVGPVTAAPLRLVGIRPMVPDRFRLGALVRSLVAHLPVHATQAVTPAGTLRVWRSEAVLDGRRLSLSPAGLAVLHRLAAADGAVVTREQILAVLPGTAVDPHVAEVAVARLRDALPDRDLVTTVVKRGYRLAVADR